MSSMKQPELIDLSQRLLIIPKEIASLQLEILLKSNIMNEVSKQIITAETKIRVNIASKLDDVGKKLYPNEDSRKAAFQEISEEDHELNELKKTTSDLDQEILKLKIDLEFLINEQKNIRSILYFFSNESNN